MESHQLYRIYSLVIFILLALKLFVDVFITGVFKAEFYEHAPAVIIIVFETFKSRFDNFFVVKHLRNEDAKVVGIISNISSGHKLLLELSLFVIFLKLRGA